MTEAELTDPDLRRKQRRYDIAKLTLSGLAVILCAATLVVVVIVLGQITTVTTTISDCTTPTGKCYQQAQQRAREGRAQLVNSAVAAQVCGKTSRTVEEMQACVTRTLQEIGDR
jgi:hypothetical protein